MFDSSLTILLITAIASAISILSIYSVYGNVIKHETVLHDLRVRVESLQHSQAMNLAGIKAGAPSAEIAEAKEIPDQPDREATQTPDTTRLENTQPVEDTLSSSTKAA